ncbi:competence protein ComEC [Nocardioides baekrokdamisoli]|uniref:Competence protein ComEC n=1 Tax=Nocardioides baekrokdamisoli TaxID=1804624 RepID=A0A3G9IV29_9ACTN|nr:ComEC/Rec2 family competence protein [Nocardioides baekrokdamisoli]BBH16103.1 competence protein ComEC [Nocardioides baekrokdamisoli]
MRDYRLCAVAAAAWSGALIGHGKAHWAFAAAGVLLILLACSRRWTAAVVLGMSLSTGAWLGALHSGGGPTPLRELAAAHAQVRVVATIAAAPHAVVGRYAARWVMPVEFRSVEGRGTAFDLVAEGLISGAESWSQVKAGSLIEASGQISESGDGPILSVSVPPAVLASPGPWRRAAEGVRGSIRRSVASAPEEPRALLPALVDGERTSLSPQVVADFRTTGLTHLAAVSGTNAAITIGFVVILARRCGVRGRGLTLAGGLAVVAFVGVAGPEPSVLRAAVMGSIGLIGMADRDRGLRALGGAVLALVLFQTSLAWTWGFALSVAATAGILIVGPDWRDGLMRWLPRPVAEAIAVPAAAQLACTPLVAAISGQVSLVAVAANIAAEPAVAPATILGLLAGLTGLVLPPVGAGIGSVACVFASWILWVAHHGADFPRAAIGWGTGALAIGCLVVLTWLVAALSPRLLRRRWIGVVVALVSVMVLTIRIPVLGWPPDGWVLVACDVGQGDGLVLRTGDGEAVVIDTGPDPTLIDTCLTHLRIKHVRLLALTHFHADHVNGIAGVFRGRQVDAIWTTRLQDPPGGVRVVDEAVGHVPEMAAAGGHAEFGDVRLDVLWPLPDAATAGPGDGSTANESSVVMLVHAAGISLLLTGDLQPEGQAALAARVPGLHVDVLKVPHHGSRYQDGPWLQSLGAAVAIISVGAGNDYGHPARSTLDLLSRSGARVVRTDESGEVAVVVRQGKPEALCRTC